MEKKGTSVFSNGLIWFGAGVSLAEILTGTYFKSSAASDVYKRQILHRLDLEKPWQQFYWDI